MAADRLTGRSFATRSEVISSNGMVASAHPLATQIGLDILKKGGHAVDAAIATNAALGLMEPTNNGIGGDLYALVWDAGQHRLLGLNASGKSPKLLNRQWFVDNGYRSIPPRGPLPVTVPGAVDGWFELHDRFGRLPIKDLLEPAVAYAREGFPVTEVVAWEWRREVEELADQPGFVEQFTIDGKPPSTGDIWTNRQLATTLEALAESGRDLFYEGDVAQTIVRFMQKHGGFLSMDDLVGHRSEWVEPVGTTYRGYDVWELPPNTQGLAVLQMLNLLELHDVTALGFGSAEHLHLLTECKKIAYEDRARYYADPEFNDIPFAVLASKAYAQARAVLFDPRHAAPRYASGEPDALRIGDTTYLTSADNAGNMVSLIQSDYRGMGSGMTPPGLGFSLQDRGELFSLDPDHANCLEGGKRPFHTIIPGFVTHAGEPWLSFGVMGGDMQPQGHVQILANLIDFGMNLQEAGDAPRMNHTGSSTPTGNSMADGGTLNLETGFDQGVIEDLRKKGHSIAHVRGIYGGYQAIARNPDSGAWHGASESRKDGQAAGY
jgi:gamma-glutamyltranspeptidase/glutathione hydrolase